MWFDKPKIDPIKEYQRRIAVDPFDREALNGLSILAGRLTKPGVDNYKRPEGYQIYDSLSYLLEPLLKPIEIKETRNIKEHRFILLSGANPSYHMPFIEGRLYLAPPQRIYSSLEESQWTSCILPPDQAQSEGKYFVRGAFSTIDDTFYGFSKYCRDREKGEKSYNNLLAYIETWYETDARPMFTMPPWSEIEFFLREIYAVYDFDTN